MENKLLIKHARVVDHTQDCLADIYIEDGLIREVGQINKDCQVLDATGLIVMPAFVDLHAHLRDPGLTQKENLQTGCMSAVAGGFTTINAMANTKPICSSLAVAEDVVSRARVIGKCDVYQSMSLTKNFENTELSHLDELAEDTEQSVVKFISEDGLGIRSGELFFYGLQKCGQYKRPLLIHAEDHDFSKIDMAIAEDLETIRDLYLAQLLGEPVHFCHVSTKYSAEKIIEAKMAGHAHITFEVTPHHLALTDAVDFRVNPPLRSKMDQRYLIEAIRQGYVDAIATDHAPHTPADKAAGAPGMVGFETAFAVCYTTLVREEGISIQELSKLMSYTPAKLMRVNKGEIQPGVIADLVIVDPDKQVVIDSEQFFSKGRNTPFHGRTYYGEILQTIKAGKTVYQAGGECK